MNLNEILKAHGIDEDNIGKILAAMKEHKIFTAAEENLDIRYGKLKTDYDNLKKDTAGFGDLQGKAAGYEKDLNALKAENERLKTKLVKVETEAIARADLIEAGCTDVKYALFLLQENGELMKDENGKIKDWENKLSGLKTQAPAFFENAKTKQILENKLQKGEPDAGGITKEAFDKMGYNDRLKLYNENPEAYKQMTNG